jgi:hexosaminidase
MLYLFTTNITSGQPKKRLINIIPQPNHLTEKEGSFRINGATHIFMDELNPKSEKLVHDFICKLNKAKHYRLSTERLNTDIEENFIQFSQSKDLNRFGQEGYEIIAYQESIKVEASTDQGMFYAIQTLYQLLPPQIFSSDAIGGIFLDIPCVEIKDQPRFAWRGNMLDPSRHFISIDYIKQNLDYLASLKMNKFHWHLTDDQGWRIEIKSLPKLTEIGAWRVDRNHEKWHNRTEAQEGEAATYGGYYTQEDIKEIIQYAADRYIEIIPEIDMPGHSRAAISSYPEISCDNGKYTVATGGVMSENTYCPGKEVTFEFTEKVLKEVMSLFPSNYVHIGGDECNKDSWKVCEHCQDRIKEEGLNDEHELQSYFIKRVERIINAEGKLMIGWDEILEGGLAPNATVMSWRGTQGGITAAKAGHDVVMSPWGFCYLDLKQGATEVEPDYGYGKLLLSTAYSFDPIPEDFTEKEASHILGVQGNLWGESMQTPFDLNYMMFPRLYAIAEVGWTQVENKNWQNFIDRVEFSFRRLNAMNVNYAPSMYNVKIEHEGNVKDNNLYMKLSTEAGNTDIRFTTDGTIPNAESEIYSTAIRIDKNIKINAQAFKGSKAIGRISTKEFEIHKAAGKKVKFLTEPNPKYNTTERGLTDCIRGNFDISKETWTGFRASDAELIIDLEKEESVSNITVSLLHRTKSWIFLPLEVVCEVSVDGKKYNKIDKIDYREKAVQPGQFIEEANFTFKERKVRYIRIKAKSMKTNPDWHIAPGDTNWIFMDEIIVF